MTSSPLEGSSRPPRLARWLVRVSSPAAEREGIVGDLEEEFLDVRLPRLGTSGARRWYWAQALRTAGRQALARAGTSLRREGRGHRPPDPPPLRGSRSDRGIHHHEREGILDRFLRDVRIGLRSLRQAPGFTLLTVVTLALAIGVNTAIFSMINVLLLQPLPFRDPETLAFIYSDQPRQGIERAYVSEADFLDFRRELASFTDLGAVRRGTSMVLAGVEEPTRVVAWEATDNTFDLWRIDAALGRTFADGEDEPGTTRVALLSHGLWQRRYAADPDVLGTTVRLDGHPTTLVGVMPEGLEFGSLAQADLWVPLRIDPAGADRENRYLWTFGRLAPDVGHDGAAREVAGTARRLEQEYPQSNAGWTYRVLDMDQVIAPEDIWTIFYLLVLTVGFVMLIACSNVASMMLARGSTRQKEVAVRAALGAGRARLLGQLLTESLLLSLAAGALGLLVARASLDALVWMVGDNAGTNFFELLAIDSTVLAFVGAVSVVAPLLFGFLPALRSTRTDLVAALKEGFRGSSDAAGRRGRRFLVASQVALALSLMVVAGLLIRSMASMRTADRGYRPEGVQTLRLELPDGKYPEEHDWRDFFDAVLERVEAIPAVESVAWVSRRPLADAAPPTHFHIDGEPMTEWDRAPWAGIVVASPAYAEVMELPVLGGRFVEASDREDGRRVAVVNQDLVDRFFDGRQALGARIRFEGSGAEDWLEVVGVVGNVYTGDPDNPASPLAYVPLAQNPRPALAMVLRAGADPSAAVPAVREQVRAVDPEQPLGDVRTMAGIMRDNLAVIDALISIFISFAVFALVMASMGIYGVVSFTVSRQTREIGIRMALGAEGRSVLGMVARQVLWLVGSGVVVGSLAAAVLARILSTAVPGMSALDPVALVGVATVLALAAGLAAGVPARRAVRVDPVVALQAE